MTLDREFGDLYCEGPCTRNIVAYYQDTPDSIRVRAAGRGWVRFEGKDLCPKHADISNACAADGSLEHENVVCPASGELPGTDQKPVGGS